MKVLWAVALLTILFLPRPLFPQERAADTAGTPPPRRIRSDSLTTPLISIPLLGSVDRSLSSGVIDDSARRFLSYENLSDLLQGTPGAWTFNLGSPGTFDDLTLGGLGSRDVAILGDGILLNDPYTGTYNTSLTPMEEIGRAEAIPATRSFLYGLNAAAGAINLVTPARRAIHPLSEIRYSQGGYGYSLLDGLISEDVIRGLNVSAGARHTAADGRFPNSDDDAWGGRLSVRYDLPSGVNLFASEVYNQTRLDLNGGIDSATAEDLRFDRIQATVRNTDSYEKVTRHDVRVGIGVSPRSDSTAVHLLTLYYSHNLREYRDENNRPGANSLFLQQNQQSTWYGLRATEHRMIADQALDFGIELYSRRARTGAPTDDAVSPEVEEGPSPELALFAKTDFRFREALRVSAYGRFDRHASLERFSGGADGAISAPGLVELFGGASQSYRFPTIQELQGTPPVVSPLGTDDPERHRLLEGGVRTSFRKGSMLELKLFYRTIDDQITVIPQNSAAYASPFAFSRRGQVILRGIAGSGKLRAGSYYIDGTAQYIGTPGTADGSGDFPAWTGTGGVYFWDSLFGGHLDLKTGVRGSFFSSYRGRGFDEQALIDVPSSAPAAIGQAGIVDFFLIAHLGDAYIHFIWENLLDRQYVTRLFYPMPDRNIRLGVTWYFVN